MLNLILLPARLVTCNSLEAADFITVPDTTWYFSTSARACVLLERYDSVVAGSRSNAWFVGAKTVNSPGKDKLWKLIHFNKLQKFWLYICNSTRQCVILILLSVDFQIRFHQISPFSSFNILKFICVKLKFTTGNNGHVVNSDVTCTCTCKT